MASRSSTTRVVDERALQTNQVLIVTLVAISFVVGSGAGRWLVLFTGLSLAIGAAFPGYGPFQLFYRHVLKQYGVVKPRPQPGDPAPHRFAQTLGAIFLLIGVVFFFAGFSLGGVVFSVIVLALALVNLVFHFCAGCYVFLQIARFRGQPRGAA